MPKAVISERTYKTSIEKKETLGLELIEIGAKNRQISRILNFNNLNFKIFLDVFSHSHIEINYKK